MRPTKFFSFACGLGLSLAMANAATAASVFSAVPSNGAVVADNVQGSPVDFVIDDGSVNNDIGLNNTAAGTATQFMWFNRFTVDPTDLPLDVDQIRIFWDAASTQPAVVGNAISLEIFVDADNSPANGATHLLTQNDTIAQVGTSFDIYNLDNPAIMNAGSDLLVGVVDRWVTTGVTTTKFPAAIDTTASQVRSWVAADASGTPPTPPVIPSSGLFGTIDSFGLPGNWMIRATGTVVPVELQSFEIE